MADTIVISFPDNGLPNFPDRDCYYEFEFAFTYPSFDRTDVISLFLGVTVPYASPSYSPSPTSSSTYVALNINRGNKQLTATKKDGAGYALLDTATKATSFVVDTLYKLRITIDANQNAIGQVLDENGNALDIAAVNFGVIALEGDHVAIGSDGVANRDNDIDNFRIVDTSGEGHDFLDNFSSYSNSVQPGFGIVESDVFQTWKTFVNWSDIDPYVYDGSESNVFNSQHLAFVFYYSDPKFLALQGNKPIITIITPPELDVPVRVQLSENVQGPEVETGISVSYLPNHSIRKEIGQAFAIDDEINTDDTLYEYVIATRELNDGLVTYTGETMLGRLANKTLYTPSSLAKAGPFTGRSAFIEMLNHFISDGASWLEYDAALIPEFVLQTSAGLITPTIKGLLFKQGDDTKGETTYSARDWLNRLFRLFADDYKLRVNQAGKLVVAPPYYLSNTLDLLINFPESPEVVLTAVTGYQLEYVFNATTARIALSIRKRSEVQGFEIDILEAAVQSYTYSSASLDYNVGITLTGALVRVSILAYVGSEDFIVTGAISGPSTASIEFKSLYDEQLLMENEARIFDLSWLYFEAEAKSRSLEYVTGEVFDPAYVDHEPPDRLPSTPDQLGNVFISSGRLIRNFQAPNAGGIYRGWLPAAPSARTKIADVWPLQEGNLLDVNGLIELTVNIDFYWSKAAPVGSDRETQHYDAEQYPLDVGLTYKEYNDSDWNDPYFAPPEYPLDYTFPTLRIPADGRKTRIRWRISRSLNIFQGSQQGVNSGDIAFSYKDGSILIEKENYFQHSVFGGIHAWIVAPRLILNASAGVLSEGELETRAVWGDTSEHQSLIPGLAEAKLAYPNRPRKVIDASNFDMDAAALAAVCEAFVSRRWAGAEVITYEQLPPYPVRPDDLNKLFSLPQNESGVLISRDYNESHTPSGSASSSVLKFRKELALAAVFSLAGAYFGADDSVAGEDAYFDVSYWNEGAPVVEDYIAPTIPTTPSDPQNPQAPVVIPNKPTGPFTYTVATLAALAALSVKPGESVFVSAGTDTSIVTDSVFLTLQGTPAKPITIVFDDAYVLDSSASVAGTNEKPWFLNCRWLNVWGGLSKRSPTYGWYFDGNEDCNFYGMRAFESFIDGFNLYKANRRLKFYYCSAFGGYNGSDADGFYLHWESNEDNEFTECEAGFNSDDGFDAWRSTRTVLRNCRSHHNGTSYQGTTGDGNGFKLGSGSTVGAGTITVINCKAWDNEAQGFDWNSSPAPITLTSCVGWRNNRNFDLSALTTTQDCYSSDGNIADSHKANSAAGVSVVPNSTFLSTDPSNEDFLEVS